VSLDYTGHHVHTVHHVHTFLRRRRLTMLNPRLQPGEGVLRKQCLVKALQLALKTYYRDDRYQSVTYRQERRFCDAGDVICAKSYYTNGTADPPEATAWILLVNGKRQAAERRAAWVLLFHLCSVPGFSPGQTYASSTTNSLTTAGPIPGLRPVQRRRSGKACSAC